jgi:hypothetical protein
MATATIMRLTICTLHITDLVFLIFKICAKLLEWILTFLPIFSTFPPFEPLPPIPLLVHLGCISFALLLITWPPPIVFLSPLSSFLTYDDLLLQRPSFFTVLMKIYVVEMLIQRKSFLNTQTFCATGASSHSLFLSHFGVGAETVEFFRRIV